MNAIEIAAVVGSLATLGVLVGLVRAVRAHRAGAVMRRLGALLPTVALAGLAIALVVATAGYRALTHEELAAVVTVRPLAPQSFEATFVLADGRKETWRLKGDELYVDARILKWKYFANVLGVHTAYELDRVGGRYRELEDERTKERTLVSLARERPIDLFTLRRRHAELAPLLDAEYGSATFVGVQAPAELAILVSTTGLLVRPCSDAIACKQIKTPM